MQTKYQFARDIILRAPPCRSILDVGCRNKILKAHLPSDMEYAGIDLEGSGDPEITEHDLERGIPFPDGEYECVVALDVLEHVDRAHHLLAEIIRVARTKCVVALPNVYYWKFRLRFLAGRPLDASQYELGPMPTRDRHRWVTSDDNATAFVAGIAAGHDIRIHRFNAYRTTKRFLHGLDRALTPVLPNLFCYATFFEIVKRQR